MTVSQIVENKVLSIPTETVFTIKDLGFQSESWENVRVKLARMVNEGKLRKTGKGRFYRPLTSIFGEVPPSAEETVKDLLMKDGKIAGYITGYSRWNEMGLTSQISGIIQIGVNEPKRNLKRGIYNVRFIRQKNEITEDNIKYLIILDAINNIKKIPDTTIAESISRLSEIIGNLGKEGIKTLVALAGKYPAKLRALLGVMLESIGHKSAADILHESLNPLTTYSYPGVNQIFSNSHKWHIK